MRIARILLFTAATLSVQQQSLFAQTSVRLLTGPTSFTGSSNLEDGIQISGTGTYSSQIALSTSVRPCISLEAHAQWGELGLTAANRKHEMATYQSVSAGVRLHLPHNQHRHLQPWISIGAAYLKQSNFADLLNADDSEYQVWDNGMIYDMAEDAPYADAQANPMMRDYTFETRTATSHNIAIPVQIGLDLNLTSRLFASASVSTLMGTEASLDPRPDHLDWLTTAQAGIGLRLGKAHAEPKGDAFPEALLLLGDDADNDGIKDSKDRCPGTMAGAPIDKHGCPLDSDKDGIADYKDAEPHSTHRRVNERGIALNEEQWAAVMAPQSANPATFQEVFQRIESEESKQMVTPVDAKGRTPAELRLLKTFGSSKTTIPIKAVKATKTTPKTANNIRSERSDLEVNTVLAALHKAIKPTFRIQLADAIRDLNMEEVAPFLLKGEVIQKFNQTSELCLVTPSTSSLDQAEQLLYEMKENGFANAQIIGDFKGRLIDFDEVKAMRDTWSEEGVVQFMH
ncbi:MAG: hypothetical protein OSA78_00950 [Flavobacteriales bacterium]|nr:hypothetical protein [Flavobacteriales bacterium]